MRNGLLIASRSRGSRMPARSTIASAAAPAVALATALSLLLTACSAQPGLQTAPQATPDHLDTLRKASTSLGLEAAACSLDVPSGWFVEGLELLAANAPVWLAELPTDDAAAQVSSPPSFAPSAASATPSAAASASPSASSCPIDSLVIDLARVQTAALRLIETDSSDLVAGAIYRAARTDEAIARGTVVGAEPPPISDLTDLSTTVLAELALAEDQAGFIGQYFAAQLPAGIDRLALAAEAEYHQALGQLLLDLSGEDDPRQPAYQLPAINLETVPAAWADTLLALASHYAAVPAPSATDPMVTYLLVQAHRLGADPPALPFLA